MCGICGVLRRDAARPVEAPMLARMMERLRHRGPDDSGLHLDGPLGLGHRRLAIIDLTPDGRQPLVNEDANLWLVFNGEIYNYLELREELVKRGHRFRSRTDAEVILHLYEEEGERCLKALNGMFAFAIWDARARRLFAARDRLGVKPFYYAVTPEGFVFASEIKALFASGLVTPRLNAAGLADYLTFQFCLGDKTLFADVKRLPPGHSLTLGPDGVPRLTEYWRLDFTLDLDHTESYFRHELPRLLDDAARLQLRADVPVGAHLSGGLDSSTVVCLATRHASGALHTFTGGFREAPEYDETRYARLVAEQERTAHHEIFPTAEEFVEFLPKLIRAMDEPAAGPGLFPQYCVSKLAAQHVKVVLGGQGGDETFGGYTRYLLAYLEQCLKGGIAGTHEEEKYVVTFDSLLPNLAQLRGYESLLGHFWKSGLFEEEDRRYFRLIDRSNGTRAYVNQAALPTDYAPYDEYREIYYSSGCRSLINRMTWFDMKTLLPALLQVEDRTSMAVSLESRVPLLDHRIAELVASMPPMIKFRGGRSKHFFRETVQDLLPPAVLSRTDKMGFPVPLSEWYGRDPVRGFVRETLLGESARRHGLVDTQRLETHLQGERRYGRGIWGLLCLELWMHEFLD